MRNTIRRMRQLLAPAAVALTVAVLVPPVASDARHFVFAQAIQFAVLGIIAPALIVAGAPWRRISGSLAGRLATRHSHHAGTQRALAVLVTYLAVLLAWRLPLTVNALVRHPALLAAETVTLLWAGCALWLELIESPPFLPGVAKPLRAVCAAVPMWAIWASAYIMGFSGSAWFGALARPPGHGLGMVADQEIATALLWAIPALAFVPVVFYCGLTWLRDNADRSDPDEDLRAIAGRKAATGLVMPRPPRGWRSKSA